MPGTECGSQAGPERSCQLCHWLAAARLSGPQFPHLFNGASIRNNRPVLMASEGTGQDRWTVPQAMSPTLLFPMDAQTGLFLRSSLVLGS